MKLDKIKFAGLISMISSWGFSLDEYRIRDIDNIIDFDIPVAEKQYVSADLVDELLKQMIMGQKIPAIKAYRELCHAGLKESKDAVEKYWVNKPAIFDNSTMRDSHPSDNATLGDILHSAGHNKAGSDFLEAKIFE